MPNISCFIKSYKCSQNKIIIMFWIKNTQNIHTVSLLVWDYFLNDILGCNLTKVKILKIGSAPGSPFDLEDKAPWTSWMFNFGGWTDSPHPNKLKVWTQCRLLLFFFLNPEIWKNPEKSLSLVTVAGLLIGGVTTFPEKSTAWGGFVFAYIITPIIFNIISYQIHNFRDWKCYDLV